MANMHMYRWYIYYRCSMHVISSNEPGFLSKIVLSIKRKYQRPIIGIQPVSTIRQRLGTFSFSFHLLVKRIVKIQ